MSITKEGKLAYQQSTEGVCVIDLKVACELGYFTTPLFFKTRFEPTTILIMQTTGHLFALGMHRVQKWPKDPRDNLASYDKFVPYQILDALWTEESKFFIAACVPGLYIFNAGAPGEPKRIRTENYHCLCMSPCRRFTVAGGNPFLVVIDRITQKELMIIEDQRVWDIQASSTLIFFSFTAANEDYETRSINLMESKSTALEKEQMTEAIQCTNLEFNDGEFIAKK